MKRLLTVAIAALASAAPASAVTVVTADRMLDVTNGTDVERPAVLIGDNGPIVQVGKSGSIQIPVGARHIDLAGETLVPEGLIAMRVHLNSHAEMGYQRLKYTDSFWAAIGPYNARKDIEAGRLLEHVDAVITDGELVKGHDSLQ